MHLSEIWHSKKNDCRLSRTQVPNSECSPFAVKKEPFGTVKGVLLRGKTNRFERQKDSFCLGFVHPLLCLRCASDAFS